MKLYRTQSEIKLLMYYILVIAIFLSACNSKTSKNSDQNEVSKEETKATENILPLDKIKLPPGFKIDVYADDLPNARSMDISENGVLFVGTKDKGDVYAVKDTDGNFKTDKKWIIGTNMNSPNGVALKDGDLYLAEISRIWKYPQIENHLENPQKELFADDYPTKEHHGWKYIAFGPDGNLYVPVGAPCNICESGDEIFATITRINMSTKEREIVHRGVRNTVGMTWHPQTKELWFTDNGGDRMGEELPADELNYAPKEGMHFGYPYCHQGDIPDADFGKEKKCSAYTPPAGKLGPHVAALGLEFYTGNMFPESYRNQIFIAEHGSWNRSTPLGYRIMLVRLEGNKPVSYEIFAEGWLEDGAAWGRPVDIELLQDGSMLISDDKAGVVYRISYQAN
jgi:glucose/arabinose dehydrogenase